MGLQLESDTNEFFSDMTSFLWSVKSLIAHRYSCKVRDSSCIVFAHDQKAMSSAKRANFTFEVVDRGKSWRRRRKSVGLNTEPWGLPVKRLKVSDW